jgi:hypothetical protein
MSDLSAEARRAKAEATCGTLPDSIVKQSFRVIASEAKPTVFVAAPLLSFASRTGASWFETPLRGSSP